VSVKIRLQRIGRKKQPTYRIVVTESRNPRNGEVIEAVGNYCPYIVSQPITLDLEKVEAWRKKGAIMTDAVTRLVRQQQKAATAAPAAPEKKAKTSKATPVVEAPKIEAAPVVVETATVPEPVVETVPEMAAEIVAEPPVEPESAS
jgi:small subunit ribosomal protein S16